MKEYSQEIIEIDGTEYTLFLNRAGILAWERYAKSENENVFKLRELYNEISKEGEVEITDETDPLKDTDSLLKMAEFTLNSYRKLYWIMLRTNYSKMTYNEATELFDKAIKEYGREQVIALGDQMVRDANTDRVTSENTEIKKLTALRPTE
jgi:L-lactate utilization protein LutC